MEHKDYIEKWLNGTLSEEEQKLFEGTDEYKALSKLSNALNAFKAPEYNVAEGYQKLIQHKTTSGKVVAMNWVRPLLKVAAVFLVLVSAYFLFFETDQSIVVQTSVAETTDVTLPDQSKVMLSVSSVLTYQENNWKDNRTVNLEGEAFFKVAKGSAFDVVTSGGIVTVTGTAFNVKNRPNYFEVICYEGSVNVASTLDTIRLRPHESFRVVNNTVSPLPVVPDDSPGWMRHESSFYSVPFRQVIDELERQFGVTVNAEHVDTNQLFTGKFSNTDIHLALESISFPLSLKYRVANKKVILRSDHK